MLDSFLSITYPPIPITKIGPVFFSLHGVFAGIGFCVGGWFLDFAWGYEILPGYDVAPQHNGLECSDPLTTCGTYHHVAMYDMLLALVVFYIFMNLKKRYEFGPGSWMGLWAVWYGVQRSILDTLRFGMGDATIGSFTWNQVGGLLLALLGFLYFL